MKKLIAVLFLLLIIKSINAQPKKFDNILYGVAYYHEYMPCSDEIQSKLVSDKAKEIGLIGDNQLTYPIVMRYGTNDQGKTIHYYLNYSGKEQSVIYNFDKGTNLLTNKALKKGDSFILKPWDLLIVEE